MAMINNPAVRSQQPCILLVTPPPIDERQRVIVDQTRGFIHLRRTADNTERYAEACREVGSRMNIPVVDIWSSFLFHAGWVKDTTLLGSRDRPLNEVFQALFSDGEAPNFHIYFAAFR